MKLSLFGLFQEVTGGLLIGMLFGFFLQKAGVTNTGTIKKQLLLKDFTVMKVILSAIASGSLLLYLYRHFVEHKDLIISTTTLSASLFGGAIFGIGMALLGYCPGTCIGALAQRCRLAFWGILGMIFGAFIYAKLAPLITNTLKPSSLINKSTLDQILPVSAPWIIASLALIVIGFWSFDKVKKGS